MNLLVDAGDETGVLWTWLNREDDLRGKIRTKSVPPPPESMSIDVVIAADGDAIAALARSVCRYLEVREPGRGTELELTVTRPNGEKVRIVVARGTAHGSILDLLLGAHLEGTDATSRS
ncbi:hypothetical protein [Lentzea sp. NPDC092896]|uniref:effector-associated constant component EACC1 n=1 Tax=Lentzea sp. NPDC092896 TaxID=3364127 RepID=UPI0038048C45